MAKLVLNSYAKLNLYLVVKAKRRDNYHTIETIFERISLVDKITLVARQDKKIRIITNSADIPKDNSNLAYKAALLLQDSLKINKGVDIKIIKRIPVGSGMAGGSSNAAAVLLGLNKLWNLRLKQVKLINFARSLGADVAFFVHESSFALGKGRGDDIKTLNMLKRKKFWHILVAPKIKVSTALIYKEWDKQNYCKISQKRPLTRTRDNVKILCLALKENNLSLIGKTLFNSLQQVTFRLHPEIRQIKEKLSRLKLEAVLMSGSGCAVFGLVPSRKEAMSLRRVLRKNKSWQVFVTRTS